MEKENQKWKVCVRSYTFNHAPYITDTMNGFTMQQTDFPFVCCIVDDASTDGEKEVIRKYLYDNFDFDTSGEGELYEKKMDYGTLIYARHKTNHNCYFAVVLLDKNHNGSPELKKLKRSYISEWEDSCEYEAICEGDDYWIDPLKLQTQVDFLEEHPDCSMCFHSVNVIKENGSKEDIKVFNHLQEKYYNINEIIAQWTIPTCSVLYRIEYLTKIPKNKNFQYGDNVLWSTLLRYGKGYCFDEKMGTYRRQPGGWTAQGSYKSNTKQIIHFEALFKEFPEIEHETMDNKLIFYYSLAFTTGVRELKLKSLKYFFQGLRKYKMKYIKELCRSISQYIKKISK